MAARALTRSGAISPGYFTWLASDGWGKQSAVVNEIQEFAVGAITVELESKKIHGKSGRIALSLGWSAISKGPNLRNLSKITEKWRNEK